MKDKTELNNILIYYEIIKREYNLIESNKNELKIKANVFLYFQLSRYLNIENPKEYTSILLKAKEQAETESEKAIINGILKTHKEIYSLLIEYEKQQNK